MFPLLLSVNNGIGQGFMPYVLPSLGSYMSPYLSPGCFHHNLAIQTQFPILLVIVCRCSRKVCKIAGKISLLCLLHTISLIPSHAYFMLLFPHLLCHVVRLSTTIRHNHAIHGMYHLFGLGSLSVNVVHTHTHCQPVCCLSLSPFNGCSCLQPPLSFHPLGGLLGVLYTLLSHRVP